MLSRVSVFALILAAIVFCVSQAAAGRASAAPAAVFPVNSFVDQKDDGLTPGTCHAFNMPAGTCTLRAAIMQANRTSAPSANIIVPAGIYSLTIPSQSGEDETNGDLNLTFVSGYSGAVINIVGAGAATTIVDAGQLDRVLSVGTSRIVNISGMTIRNGYLLSNSGGGILNYGTLTVNNSTITGNFAYGGGGIAAFGGDLSLTNTTLSQNMVVHEGGGIEHGSTGQVMVVGSTLYANHAQNGGGIYSTENPIVINSTLSGNIATNEGGGIALKQTTSVGTMNVYNSSILYNVASPAQNLSYRGGGIFIDSGMTFNMRNTLLAGNYSSVNMLGDDCSGPVHVFGNNLLGTDAACTIDTTYGSSNPLNSLSFLGPLQNNGGPTWTHALLAGSNAIDAGDQVQGCVDNNSVTLITDQRGVPRALDGTGIGYAICDVGAFEYRPPLYLPLIQR